MMVGIAVALGLYFSIGRSNEEVPPWVVLPTGASVQVSASAPAEDDHSTVRYYLRFVLPGDASTVLVQFTSGISNAKWDAGLPRIATHDDLGLRSNWPAWVKEHMHRVRAVSDGRAMTSHGAGEQLYAYAWPADEGCIVELVQEVQSRAGTTVHSIRPAED
jgi:hypothetical protein